MTSLVILSNICHQIPERTLTINGQLLPLCARCTGIYCGFAIGYLYQLITLKKANHFPSKSLIMFLAATIVLLAIDGLGGKIELWNLPNNMRFLIGLLCGSSISLILLPLFNFFFVRSALKSNINTKQYLTLLLLVGLMFFIRDFSISFYIYILFSVLGLISMYTLVNVIFIGMIYQINKKKLSIKNIAIIFGAVTILLLGEGILFHVVRIL